MPLTADTDDKVEQSKWIPSTDDAMVLFSVEEQQVSLVLKAERMMVSSVRGEKTTGNRDCCSVSPLRPQPCDVRFFQAVKALSVYYFKDPCLKPKQTNN